LSELQVEINPFKSVRENANAYFEKSKKAKAKLKGLEEARKRMQASLESRQAKKEAKVLERKRKKEWFEKFRWFYTSENSLLCIAGKDRQSNETIVKKQMDSKDLYFHADIQGASHCILKEGREKASAQDRREAAIFAAVFSKAWNSGIAGVDVYSVFPEQVSKQAQSGEALTTGAFMIYGKREWFKKTPLEFAIGIQEKGRIVSGPLEAVKKQAIAFAALEQEKEKKSETAKKLQRLFEKKTGVKAQLDEIASMLPGDCGIKAV